VWPFLLLALLLLPVFRAIERRAADPILRMSLFGSRQAVLANLLSAGAGLGEAGLVFLPALAIAALGVAISTASFMLIPVVLALSVGAPTAGRYLDRYGSKVVVIVGTALLAVGMAVLGLGAASLVLFIVAGVLIGLGLAALLGAPVRYIMLNEAPPADRAAAQGAVTLFASVGQLVGGAAIGALIASQAGDVAGYSTAYLVISGVAVVLTLLALSLKDRAAEQATAQRQMAAVPAANSAPDPVNLVPSMD
jgi:MFS family permease